MLRIGLVTLLLCLAATVQAADKGLIKFKSPHSVEKTMDRLEAALRVRNITVFNRIDHAGGAAQLGKELRPTELLIFGSPALGTALMSSQQSIGIDLPLKALVWEDAKGQVWLGYNDPAYLSRRHGVSDREQAFSKMLGILKELAETATGGH